MRKKALHPRTTSINIKQKAQAKLARHQALRWLAETFPHAFNNSTQIQPLKKGIMDDILIHAERAQTAGFSKSKLREAVVLFTRRIDYLICLKAREIRIDLYGNPTTAVTPEEAEHATLKIKKRIEKGAKNAKKPAAPKPTNTHVSKIQTINHTQTVHASPQQTPPPHHYPDYTPSSRSPHITPTSTRTTAVVIKPSRVYDPNAVARLKEKLGLSRKEEI